MPLERFARIEEGLKRQLTRDSPVPSIRKTAEGEKDSEIFLTGVEAE
jgi:hypothetical protein